jgi:hypothetical protein
LEAQLLNTVVQKERPDLDKQKNELVVKVSTAAQKFKPFLGFNLTQQVSFRQLLFCFPDSCCQAV